MYTLEQLEHKIESLELAAEEQKLLIVEIRKDLRKCLVLLKEKRYQLAKDLLEVMLG